MYLVAGLGNPGVQYQLNRHNAGFMLVDRLAAGVKPGFARVLKRSLTCQLHRRGQQIVLSKPLTYMNLSGGAVSELLLHFPTDLDRLLVVYDDFALPLGKIRLRASGSSGGHNGMESVIGALGTDQVHRLRLGIGAEGNPEDYRDYVLADFRRHELEFVDSMLDRATQAVDTWLVGGIEKAMAQFNG